MSFSKSLLTRFQYMLLLRGATEVFNELKDVPEVSIHAPLARSNTGLTVPDFIKLMVSIHAPLARSNYTVPLLQVCSVCFNTCSSCEEQHDCPVLLFLLCQSFNTCSSCEEQPQVLRDSQSPQSVSIHAPLARSNLRLLQVCQRSTVSIHAPLARSNTMPCCTKTQAN